MAVKIEIDALESTVEFLRAVPETGRQAMSMAINKVAPGSGMKLARETIMEQIAFPQDYLKGDRLMVSRFSTPENLEAVIRARHRATSLARFARGAVIGRAGISVEVGRGDTTRLKAAWLVRLKKGASLTQDNYNVGLAVRIKAGEEIRNKKYEHRSWLVPGHVALLYGPSVDQVFRDVADQIGEPIGKMVSDEFFRNFRRLTA
jgi:hypothetical protein